MSDAFNLLAQQLCNKPSFDACTTEELYNLTQQYPYFAPAQILYLRKLQGSPEYNQQYQKAILYHTDPLTFESLINPEKFKTGWEWEEPVVEEKAPVEEAIIVETSLPEVKIEKEEEQKETEEEKPELPQEPVETTSVEIADELQEIPVELQVVQEEKEALPEIAPIEQPKAPLPEATQPAELPQAIQQKEESLFEPYHTVDYFASQGIKLSQEEATMDRFGKQLKSFTEWLKVMKRLPVSERQQQMGAGGEQKVENLAHHSVKDSDIITEAMAEVWVKQGNRDKAKEVYRKLGLLNPSKRAYFAAKIDDLTT